MLNFIKAWAKLWRGINTLGPNPITLKLICLSGMLILTGKPNLAQPLFAEPCDSYVELLHGELEVLTKEKFDECNLFEQIIVTADSWTDFILKYRANLGEDNYAVLMYVAIRARERGDYVKAFTMADSALINVVAVFTLSRDLERAKYYVPLILDFRNALLEDLGLKAETAAGIADEYSSLSELDLGRDDVEQTIFIPCLIGTDAFTVPLADVLVSTTFTSCLENH